MSADARGSRFLRFLKAATLYAVILVVTLVLLDLVLMATGLFPPQYTPGHPDLGWVTGRPTGQMHDDVCVENSTGEVLHYKRNEEGIRADSTVQWLRSDTSSFKIGVGGDSQTDLCAANSAVHFGVMEKTLRAHGIPAIAFAYPAGKYAPLQAYLALRKPIAEYHAKALVLNFYTGNDAFDMLRFDDRPHFVKDGSGYRIAPPVWYQEYDPGETYHSRVMYLLRTVGQRTGLRNLIARVRYLRDVAREQGQGLGAVFNYMNDLRKSSSDEVGYRAAFVAQMLNQEIFFYHFPDSRRESIARIRALLQLVRQEHPNLVLVLSALPSYQLVAREHADSALVHVLARLPFTYEQSIQHEQELYDTLRTAAGEYGWVFVDNLPPLRAYTGVPRLYNNFDYHYLPVASEIIGRTQAQAIEQYLAAQRPASTSRPTRGRRGD